MGLCDKKLNHAIHSTTQYTTQILIAMRGMVEIIGPN